ncbi:basic helix-loop-helix ARNT-like protein 1 [Saccostrea echinata]|uniref:basic helix-loop-helix ARNT-like protein 1 n=1 Tax=Saccostrea echinata TaxID=191078 RepID=UPI002A82A9A3|nr:basic helix-loop-helix ARNT-like protein 1 [Saccostrea echinata]
MINTNFSIKRKESVTGEEKFLETKKKLRREGEKLRRERLNHTLSLLAEEVPWLKQCERRPDKSSILKLTVNYLKLNIGIKKRNLNSILPSFLKDSVTEEFLESVAHGSLLIVSESGTILYMSESLTQQLGWLQVDVLGSPINKMLHKDDVELFKLQFNQDNNFHYTTEQYTEENKTYIPVHSSRRVKRSFFVRMQNLSHVSGTTPKYEEMRISGHVYCHTQDKKKDRSVLNESWLVGVCIPVARQALLNMQAYEDSNNPEWVSQHAMDGKLWYQDHRIALVVGVMPNEHIGMSVYDLVNKNDLKDIACSHMKIMTDDEIPCTVFRLSSLNGCGPEKYIKSRSVIVKDAWTKKNLFIVSLNQHIRDEEGQVLLQEQGRRVRALIAATKSVTLQEKNFSEENSDTDVISTASDTSQSPAISEGNSDDVMGSKSSVDTQSPSDSDSIPGVTLASASPCEESVSNSKHSLKKESLPLLKSLLIGPNHIKGTVNKCAIVERKSQNSTSLSEIEMSRHLKKGYQLLNMKAESTNYDEFCERLTDINSSISVTEKENVSLDIIDDDLVNQTVTEVPPAGKLSPASLSGGNKSAVNKQHFMTQISQFFPSVSSEGVLHAGQNHCEINTNSASSPRLSVVNSSNRICPIEKRGSSTLNMGENFMDSSTPLLENKEDKSTKLTGKKFRYIDDGDKA